MNTPTNIRSLPKPATKTATRPEPPAAPVSSNLQKPATEGHVQLQFQVPADVRRAEAPEQDRTLIRRDVQRLRREAQRGSPKLLTIQSKTSRRLP